MFITQKRFASKWKLAKVVSVYKGKDKSQSTPICEPNKPIWLKLPSPFSKYVLGGLILNNFLSMY